MAMVMREPQLRAGNGPYAFSHINYPESRVDPEYRVKIMEEQINHNEKVEFPPIEFEVQYDGVIDGHKVIDLGLPSGRLWAVTNLGATEPWEIGEFIDINDISFIDYITSEFEIIDSAEIKYVYAEDEFEEKDPVQDNWKRTDGFGGSRWETPDEDNLEELLNCCMWEKANIKGTNGYLLTAENGKKMFLPFFKNEMSEVGEQNLSARYLSSSLIFFESSSMAGTRIEGRRRILNLSSSNVGISSCFYNAKNILIRPILDANTQLPTPQIKESSSISNNDIKIPSIDESKLSSGDGRINGHIFVDLGLSSGNLWAQKNVGAYNPTKQGYQFAVTPERKFIGKWIKKELTSNPNSLTIDQEIEDVYEKGIMATNNRAIVYWGNQLRQNNYWRIPTSKDFEELISECKIEIVKIQETAGCLFTGKNGNTLFLPFFQSNPCTNGVFAHTMEKDINTVADYLSSSIKIVKIQKYNGMDKGFAIAIFGISFYGKGINYLFYSDLQSYLLRLVASKDSITTPLKIEQPLLIDLGLKSGLLWADSNLNIYGKNYSGNYFSWNSIDVPPSFEPPVSTDMPNAPEYYLGKGWRLPTKEEFDELLSSCTCEEIKDEINNINGLKLIGPSGKSLFIPYGGYMEDEKIKDNQTKGFLWTSTAVECDVSGSMAYALCIEENSVELKIRRKYLGLNIRPVHE